MAELTVLDEKLAEVLGLAQAAQVVTFALPLQRKHVDAVREQSVRLAGEEDPSEAA